MKVLKEPASRFHVSEERTYGRRAEKVIHAESELDALQRYFNYRKDIDPIQGDSELHVTPLGETSVFKTYEDPADSGEAVSAQEPSDDDAG